MKHGHLQSCENLGTPSLREHAVARFAGLGSKSTHLVILLPRNTGNPVRDSARKKDPLDGVRPSGWLFLYSAGWHASLPLTDDTDLHLLVDGRRLDAMQQRADPYVYNLPGVPVRIVSRAEAPHELGLACDPRCLGAALDCSKPIPTSDTATVLSRTNIVLASPLPALGSTRN